MTPNGKSLAAGAPVQPVRISVPHGGRLQAVFVKYQRQLSRRMNPASRVVSTRFAPAEQMLSVAQWTGNPFLASTGATRPGSLGPNWGR